jgi:hypothetical protein
VQVLLSSRTELKAPVRVQLSGQKVYVEIVMIMRRGKVRALRVLFLAAFLVLGASAASQAGPLGVNIDPYPDIMSGFITTTYNATSGAFSASGWALTLDTGTGQQNITTNFRLTATIDKTGQASAAALTIGSAASPYLYTATLMGFAFNAIQGGVMEFLFGPATGSYVPSIYSDSKPLDLQLSAGTGFMGTFATGFTSSSGTAELRGDPPPQGTPEPSALLVMMIAAAGLLGATTHAQRSRRGLAAIRLS